MPQKKKKAIKKTIKKIVKKQPVVISKERQDVIDNFLKPLSDKTRTFISTTFDDTTLLKPLPVRKEGFHIVGETNDVDLNEQVIKKFEADNAESKNVENIYFSKDFLKDISNKYETDEVALKDMPDNSNDSKKFRSMKISRIGNDKILDEVEYNKPSITTNRELVNNANELFDDLASRVGQITKEYWLAKQKLVLINKFMNDYYSNKSFEKLEPVEKLGDFNNQLQKALDSMDGEDSDYKKMILAQIRPDKYKP